MKTQTKIMILSFLTILSVLVPFILIISTWVNLFVFLTVEGNWFNPIKFNPNIFPAILVTSILWILTTISLFGMAFTKKWGRKMYPVYNLLLVILFIFNIFLINQDINSAESYLNRFDPLSLKGSVISNLKEMTLMITLPSVAINMVLYAVNMWYFNKKEVNKIR